MYLVVAGVFAFLYLKNSMDANQPRAYGKKKMWKEKRSETISDGTETVLIHMPKVYYRIPGNDWACFDLTKKVTSLGRSDTNDICMNHPTVSGKQAEIQMRIRKIGVEKKGARYYVLKNCAHENPILYIIPDGNGETRDIVTSIVLKEKENHFYFGQIEVMIALPDRVKADGTSFTINSSLDKSAEETGNSGNTEDRSNRKKTGHDTKKSVDTNGKRSRKDLKSQIRF